MAHDFQYFSNLGKRNSQNRLSAAGSKVLGGLEKKTQACGPPCVKGNMLAVRRLQSPREKSKFVGLDLFGEVQNHKRLLECKHSLRPLLNAIRFVESSNRVHCPDGDNGASIGPLQISEQYHLDAWKHKKSFAWPRCRDLEHAENTVVAYWSRYCKDALVKNDWETLAKTHNGGPRGPAKEKTEYYWSKVLRRLQQSNPGAFGKMMNSAALRSPRKISEFAGYSNSGVVKTLKASEKKRGFPMVARSSKAAASPTSRRSVTKTSTPLRKSKFRKSSKGRLHRVGASPQTPLRGPDTKQLSPLLLRKSQRRIHWHLSEERSSDRVSLQSALHFGYWSFPGSARREKSAILLQAQWRMCSARLRYHRLQHATLIIQRRWRYSRRPVGELVTAPPAGTSCKDISDKHQQESVKVPGFPIECLYDVNISAIEEDEILAELASFLPSLDYGPKEGDLSVVSSGGNDTSFDSSSAVFQERPAARHSPPDSSRVSSDILAEDVGKTSVSPSQSSLRAWNYDMCNLDSPTCSPGKELTFAKVSIDGSLPPTPIKEWRLRKRDPTGSPPGVRTLWSASTVDAIELPPSPTQDWASPITANRKSSFFKQRSSHMEARTEQFQLPRQWLTDLDRLDSPRSCWSTSELTSIAFSSTHTGRKVNKKTDPKSLHCFTEVPDTSFELLLPSSRPVVYISEGSARDVSPSHEIKECITASDGAVNQETPVLVKRAHSSSKSIDLSVWKDKTLSLDDIDKFSLTPPARAPSQSSYPTMESSLSPAMEEELLDELTKLFQGGRFLASAPSEKSSSPNRSSFTSFNHLQCEGSTESSQGKTQSRVCGKTNGNTGFLENSVRRLDFNLEDSVGLEYGDGVQLNSRNEEERRMEMLEGAGGSASPLPRSPFLTFPQPSETASSEGVREVLEKDKVPDELSHLEVVQSADCHNLGSLQYVSEDLATSASSFKISSQRTLERSSSKIASKLGTQQTVFEDDEGFCDKAVDGNIIAVKKTLLHVVGSGTLSASAGQETTVATEQPTDDSEESLAYTTLDQYDTRIHTKCSIFVSPKVEQLNLDGKRSSNECGIINIKQSLTCRQIPFDQMDCEIEQQFSSPEESRTPLPGKNDTERLLHTSPASPDDVTSLAPNSAALCKHDRSSALSVSKKYFLQSPSANLFPRGCNSDALSVISLSTCIPSEVDSLLEGVEKKSSARHARALFACQETSTPDPCENELVESPSISQWDERLVEDDFEAMMKQRDKQRLWFPENLSGPLLMTPGAESDCSFRRSTASAWDGDLEMRIGNHVPSLQDLCRLWDEECVDLVTRSLKYKSLMTDPNLLQHEVTLAFEKPQPSGPQTIAWEIQNIERLMEKLQNRETLKELVRQQRDTIYINIATNASMRERHHLYTKWGIRRMSRGRLRKVIYELLWKDPKRYHASADLVLQYL